VHSNHEDKLTLEKRLGFQRRRTRCARAAARIRRPEFARLREMQRQVMGNPHSYRRAG